MEELRVLLVDDEEDFASTLAERLALRGIRAEVATRAADVPERLRDEDFSVLLLDLKMPGVDGLQLLAQVRRSRPAMPVIVLTGHGSAAAAEEGMQQGAFDYLMKPVNIDELIERIRHAAGENEGKTS